MENMSPELTEQLRTDANPKRYTQIRQMHGLVAMHASLRSLLWTREQAVAAFKYE